MLLGGGEHSFTDLLSRIAQSNWNALVVAPEEGELIARLRASSLQARVISLSSMKPWRLIPMIRTLKECLALSKAFQPTVVYANGSRAAFYGGLVARISRIPMVWHCRIADPDFLLDRILSRFSMRIVVNSNATARRFRTCWPEKVSVVYNGIDLQWFAEDSAKKPDWIQPDWIVILVVARASRRKRHDLVLSAFEKIAGSFPSAHVLMAGSADPLEPEWFQELQGRSSSSLFSDRIHWAGHTNDVRPWYKAASILVLASESESFGRVLVEAMACGVPVIATKSGGIPEVIRDGVDGILIAPGDVEALARAMSMLLQDDHLRISLVQSGKVRAQRFSLDRHAEEMLMIFDQIAFHSAQRGGRQAAL